MKKLISEYTDNRGKIKVNELINKSIVFNFNAESKLQQKKVTDAFEGYLEISKEWIKLADINIHFVITDDTVDNKISIEEFIKKLPTITQPNTVPWRSPPLVPEYRDNKCSKCGLKCEGVMGYCCPNYDCPMGMGGTWCSTTTIHKHFDH